MFGKNMIDIVTIIIATGAATAINRSSVKKQTIQDLKDLAETQQLEIDSLKRQIEEKDKRICHLEEIVDGYAELVREGHLAGSNGPRSGDGSANPKTTKNRSVR